MSMILILIIILALLTSCSQPPSAQRLKSEQQLSKSEQQPLLGWDLTYASVLERNKIAHDAWIWKWLGWSGQDYQSPVKDILENWKDEPILSSILIEYPDFHAGDHLALWFVRTKNHTYYWGFVKGKPYKHIKESVNTELYDRLFTDLSSWQQAEPQKPENTPVGGVPGYLGFLSLYDQGDSKQLLLSQEDFFIRDTEAPEGYKEGRLSQALRMMENKTQ